VRDSSQWLEVGASVWRRVGSPVDVNCVLLVGSQRALLIDTGSTNLEGESLARAVRDGLGDIPLLVVNTHAHYDHCLGNAAFAPEQIWASSGCGRSLVGQGRLQQRAAAAEWRDRDPLFAAAIDRSEIVIPGHLLDVPVTVPTECP